MRLLVVLLFICLSSGDAMAELNMDSEQPIRFHVVTVDNKKIDVHHYKRGHSKAVILAHGFYNSKQAVLFKEMAIGMSEDYDVFVIDFRGHGKSKGFFSWTVHEHRDLQALLDYMDTKYNKVGLVGFSLGAAISINTVARDSRVDSLIAVSAPYDFNRINYKVWQMGVTENLVYNVFQEGRKGKGIRPGWLFRRKPKPIDSVAKIKIPTLFVHGQKDWLISAKHSQKLYQKAMCDKDLIILPEGTHAEYIYRSDKEGTLKIFREWFQKTLSDAT